MKILSLICIAAFLVAALFVWNAAFHTDPLEARLRGDIVRALGHVPDHLSFNHTPEFLR